MTRRALLDLDLPDIEKIMAEWGQPAFRARQVWRAVYQRGVVDPAGLTDLPLEIRQRLEEDFAFRSLEAHANTTSADGQTTKWLLGRPDETSRIEAVLMKYERRRTACISTQAGCGMGCSFCATGQMGFVRNLSAGEIVEQVLWLGRGRPLTNIVLMGMGEPFHNYDATMAAIDRLIDPGGMRFGARRITVSTVGLAPQIRRFAAERRQVNLAVSLHAATDELRDVLVPINRRFPLETLREACREYLETAHRRLTFEWALIQGVNDGSAQAQALARWLKGMLCHVNLIPLNPTRGYPGRATETERAEAFRSVLTAQGIPNTLRVRRGIDIQAGCGQLATERSTSSAPSMSAPSSYVIPRPALTETVEESTDPIGRPRNPRGAP
jgi:23S rRNA (adenine2503-C2)-methyltransferase